VAREPESTAQPRVSLFQVKGVTFTADESLRQRLRQESVARDNMLLACEVHQY
jgi:hypothetical protein